MTSRPSPRVLTKNDQLGSLAAQPAGEARRTMSPEAKGLLAVSNRQSSTNRVNLYSRVLFGRR